MGWVLAAMLVAAMATLPAHVAWRALRKVAQIRESHAAYALVAGAVAAFACAAIERWFWRLTGLSVSAAEVGNSTSLWAMLFFAAPLEEAAKLLSLWPLYSRGSLRRRATGLVLGCSVGAGFAAAEILASIAHTGEGRFGLLRVSVAAIAHPFFAATWGQALGSRSPGRWFSSVWLVVTLFHALFEHIVFGRGAGLVGAAVPMALAMLIAGAFTLRSSARTSTAAGTATEASVVFRAMGRTLRAPKRPASMLWGAFSGLVTTGVVLSFVGFGVYLGHRMGIDFAAASEEDFRSNAPIVLLAVSAVLGFPFAGYLVAKARAEPSLSEAALGAVIALGIAVVGLYVAAPVAVVFAIAAAPVAFLLACVGAWLAMGR